MSGFNGGILRNAYPLSEAQIKDVEKAVILNNKCIAYLDENNHICFAEPFDPAIVKNFAWNQVHQMFEQDSVFFKNIYEKTGLDTFTLIETLHKTDIEGPWEGGSTDTLEAGLYRESVLIKSWDELLAEGVVHVENGNMYTNMDPDTWVNSSAEILVGELVLPNDGSITTLSDGAFDGCTHLTSIVIPNGVTSIGGGAFYYCEGLTSVTIPDSVTNIGNDAFYKCSSLTSVTIPNGVTSIGYEAFAFCDSLTSVTIGNGVTSIGEYAFSDCTSLTSIVIPNSVTSIGYDAFCNCSSLTNIAIPDSVTSIEYGAFSVCSSLTSVTIGNGVESIGENAFAYSDSLTNIIFNGTTVQWNAIEKGNNWNHDVPATYVQCSDGQVSL